MPGSSGTPKPIKLVLRTYQMGFGDCFLLSFEYSDDQKKHVLIDFGSQTGVNAKKMAEVAESISEICGNDLAVVVATHRHQDHIKGFGLKKAGAIIENLQPKAVLQPWTEDPDVPIDAKAPINTKRRNILRLANMNAFSENLFNPDKTSKLHHLRGVDQSAFKTMSFIGENNIRNKAAVKALQRMSEKRRGRYLHAKKDPGLSSILPGIQVDVLGPPTVQQYAKVKGQRSRDDQEYWHMHAANAAAIGTASSDPFPNYGGGRSSYDTRWLRYRLKKLHFHSVKNIVRTLDDAMNNTSLILLFQVNDKSFLFPGDAQIENWEFALQDEEIMAKLANVDVYKVGHHGSLNATPKSLWENFANKGAASKGKKRLQSILSTKKGKHGHEESNTEVPRKSLVKALSAKSKLHSTEDFKREQLFKELIFEL